MNDLLKFLLSVLSDRTFEQIILDLHKTIERQFENKEGAYKHVNIMTDMLMFYFNNSLASNEIFSLAKTYLSRETCEKITIDYNRNKLLLIIKP